VVAALALTGAALVIIVGLGAAARGPAGMELRRRQTLERVRGRLLAEDLEVAAPPLPIVAAATLGAFPS
jgi:hypothetical protein